MFPKWASETKDVLLSSAVVCHLSQDFHASPFSFSVLSLFFDNFIHIGTAFCLLSASPHLPHPIPCKPSHPTPYMSFSEICDFLF